MVLQQRILGICGGTWKALSGGTRRSPITCGFDTAAAYALLHRYAFRQVARLVDVGAFEHRGVVGEELHRDGVEQGRDKRRAVRDGDAEGAAAVEPGDA